MARPSPPTLGHIAGWREWVAFPLLEVPAVKAKIDTGARTSALHAWNIERFRIGRTERLRFTVHPVQRRNDVEIHCVADVWDKRWVMDSGGHRQIRYVIRTPVRLGPVEFPIELTLTDRDTMGFRMLLGRTALRCRFLVNPGASYLMGRDLARLQRRLWPKPKSSHRGEER